MNIENYREIRATEIWVPPIWYWEISSVVFVVFLASELIFDLICFVCWCPEGMMGERIKQRNRRGQINWIKEMR